MSVCYENICFLQLKWRDKFYFYDLSPSTLRSYIDHYNLEKKEAQNIFHPVLPYLGHEFLMFERAWISLEWRP